MNLTLQPVLLGSGWILIWEREHVCPLITNYSEPSTCLVSIGCSINTVFVEYLVQQECYVGHYNLKYLLICLSFDSINSLVRSCIGVMLAAVSYGPPKTYSGLDTIEAYFLFASISAMWTLLASS